MSVSKVPYTIRFVFEDARSGQQTSTGEKIGVLLCNLGTPDGTDYLSMRRYLREFLSDRRVVETSRLAWFFILNAFVLTFRPSRKGKDYQLIWKTDLNESPLKTITRSQAVKLQELLGNGSLGVTASEVVVDWGMRYGNPSLKAAVERLIGEGCERLLFFPLYPQYAGSTCGSACDKLFEALRPIRRLPTLRVVPAYYRDPLYIDELAASVTEALERAEVEPDVVVASFHGTPERSHIDGDPYYYQCLKTGELLQQKLGLRKGKLVVTFQSRFGRAEWLRPYTDETIKALALSGVKRLAVVTPGFAADCLETIDEIGRENAELFFRSGGEQFVRINCLNDSERGMRVIEGIVHRELSGWL